MNKDNYIKNYFDFSHKTVVITGGSGHLGGEMAITFLKLGSTVFILDKNIKKIDKKKFITFKNKIFLKKINLINKTQIKNSLKYILNKSDKIDILINGAGANSPKSFFDISEKDWNFVIDSQLKSTFLSCQIFGKQMIKQKHGSILNISSASAGPPLSKAFAYSAAKSGIKNLTQNLAREWATKGVRVNALRPGFFPTQWSMENFIDKKRKENIFQHTPMKRFGNPKELITAVLFICSDKSTFLTGSEIAVDGGFGAMTI